MWYVPHMSGRFRRFLQWFGEDPVTEADGSTKPTPAETSAPSAPAISVPKGELGLSGTVNWYGRIHSESNTKLQWERAYGTPGATSWGEWEKLERTDHQVSAALNMLAAPIRDATVELIYPDADEVAKEGAEPDQQREAIVSFVKDNLTNWLEPRWATLLEQIVKYGLGYGFSLHEVVWDVRQDDRVPNGQAFYVKKLAQRLPSSIKSDGWIERDGDLICIKQSGVRDGKWNEGIELPADKVLLCTWNRSGNNYQGFSAFRPGWYMAQLRADLLRILAIKHQRESCGVPVVEVEKDAIISNDQRDAIQTILENIVYHENAAIQLPPGTKINWIFSPGAANNSVLDTWNRLGIAMLEIVQAQQSSLGTNDTGSRSVGEVHDANKNTFVLGVCAWIEAALNGIGSQPYTGLVRKIIDVNFGPQKVYPVFKLRLNEAESETKSLRQWQYTQALSTAKNAGAFHATEKDEAHLRKMLGLPEVTPEERQKAIDDAMAMMPVSPFGGGKPGGKPDTEESKGTPPQNKPNKGE